MSHTPGPWNANLAYPTEQATSGIAITNGSLDLVTVKGLLEITDDYYGTVALTNCKANARLIAAAPDLLQSLKVLLQRLPEGPDFYEDAAAYRQVEDAVKRCKEVIQTITGELS